MAGVNYFTVGSNNLDAAKACYDELLGSTGMKAIFEHPSGGRLYSAKGMGMFGVLGPYDGNPACIGNGSMGGFRFENGRRVGGLPRQGAGARRARTRASPGPRAPKTHFAYFRDSRRQQAVRLFLRLTAASWPASPRCTGGSAQPRPCRPGCVTAPASSFRGR